MMPSNMTATEFLLSPAALMPGIQFIAPFVGAWTVYKAFPALFKDRLSWGAAGVIFFIFQVIDTGLFFWTSDVGYKDLSEAIAMTSTALATLKTFFILWTLRDLSIRSPLQLVMGMACLFLVVQLTANFLMMYGIAIIFGLIVFGPLFLIGYAMARR
jgi:sensor histidine kinase YesM